MSEAIRTLTEKEYANLPRYVLWRWTTSRYKGYTPEQIHAMLREREESKRLIAVADHLDISEMDYDKMRSMISSIDIERVVGIVSHCQRNESTEDIIVSFEPNEQFRDLYDVPDSDGPIEYVTLKGHPEHRLVLAAALVGTADINSPVDECGHRLLKEPHLTCFYFQQAELV